MSRTNETNPAIGWFQRNWRMVIIVLVGIVVATMAIRSGNWELAIPLSAIGLGVTLNIVAMAANRGKMPVEIDGASIDESDHCAMHAQTRLRILGDWIPVKDWLLSPGDLIIYLGLLGLVIVDVMQ